MLALQLSSHNLRCNMLNLPTVCRLYPPLLRPSGEKSVRAKLILSWHLHDVDIYASTANLDPEQQLDKSTSPCNGGLSDPPCVKPKVKWITL